MLHVPNENRRLRVASGKEIGLMILFFAIVLWLLHSKDFYERLLVNEKSNYDLTGAYLKNLIHLEPENAKMLYEFSSVLIKQGKYDLADKTLQALESSADPADRDRAVVLRYELLKRLYYTLEDKKKRAETMEELKGRLEKIARSDLLFQDPKRWLDEGWFVGDPKLRMLMLKRLAEHDPENLTWLGALLDTAVAENDKEYQRWAFARLMHREEIWLGSYGADPKSYVKKSLLLIDYYLENGRFEEASRLYMRLYEQTGKEDYLWKSLDVLLWGKRYDALAKALKSLQNRFIDDPVRSKKILDYYLKADLTAEAKRYSLELLKRKGLK